MHVPFFQIDAFSSALFAGNPAAVMLLERYPEDRLLQAIAEENNLSETAFLVRDNADWRIRWFTPTHEVALCGHATMASAAAVMQRIEPQREQVTFRSASGPLRVHRRDGRYVMDFPAWPSAPVADPSGIAQAIGTGVLEAVSEGSVYLARVEDLATVRAIAPRQAAILDLDCKGIVVTAAGEGEYDFTSRFFAPALGIAEDPATGAVHCMLAPFWAERLGRTSFRAFQASARGGDIRCRLVGDRVELEGDCTFYLEGAATI